MIDIENNFIIGAIYTDNKGLTVECLSQYKTGFCGKVLTTFDSRAFEKNEIFGSFSKKAFILK